MSKLRILTPLRSKEASCHVHSKAISIRARRTDIFLDPAAQAPRMGGDVRPFPGANLAEALEASHYRCFLDADRNHCMVSLLPMHNSGPITCSRCKWMRSRLDRSLAEFCRRRLRWAFFWVSRTSCIGICILHIRNCDGVRIERHQMGRSWKWNRSFVCLRREGGREIRHDWWRGTTNDYFLKASGEKKILA